MHIEFPFYGITIHNGSAGDPRHFPADGSLQEAYEVLKVVRGIPLFFSEHLRRLERTLLLSGTRIHPSANELYTDAMRKLLALNTVSNGNVRISVFIDDAGNSGDWWMGFTPHKYPSPVEFAEGVSVMSIQARRRDPNAKMMHYDLRSMSEAVQLRESVYETILLEPNGEITEGSRSNIFFIRAGIIYTAPDHKVLEGVTRLVVLQNIATLGLECRLESIHISQAGRCDAAFLTGTSRDVLPISRFDAHKFDPGHPIILQLQQAYNESVEEHLRLIIDN